MTMGTTIALVIVLAVVIAGAFAALWLGDKKRADDVADDPGRVQGKPRRRR